MRTKFIVILLLMFQATGGMTSLYGQNTPGDSTRVLIVLTDQNTIEGVLEKQDENVVKLRLPSGEHRIIARDVITSIIEINNTSKTGLPFVEIVFVDGSTVKGWITAEQPDTVTISMSSGATMSAPRKMIREIREIQVDKYGYRFDPNRTRLFFTTTGRSLRAGEGYFSVIQIYFPMVTYGLTDRVSLSGGFTLMPGAESQLLYGNLKFGILTEGVFQAATGVLYISIPGEFGGGILYGAGTVGNNNDAVTVGFGWGFDAENGWSSTPIIVAGGEIRVSNSVKIITENWIFVYEDVSTFVSLGIRLFGKDIAGDLGLITTAELMRHANEGLPFIPWLGFTYNFGR
ncbi:MAG: hypothetical protein GXO82_07850 [Chlorobi bacterium]|nr:hypothetical protein [Chlorobiota bacterium]